MICGDAGRGRRGCQSVFRARMTFPGNFELPPDVAGLDDRDRRTLVVFFCSFANLRLC